MDRQQAMNSLEQVIAVCNDPEVDNDTIIDNARDRCSEVRHWLEKLVEVDYTSPQPPPEREVEHGDTSGDEAAPYLPSDYIRGVEDALAIIERRGDEVRGAIQPYITCRIIRSELLSNAR